MTVIPANHGDILHVLRNLRPEDRCEMEAHVGKGFDPEVQARSLYSLSKVSIAVEGNDNIVAVGGICDSGLEGVPDRTASLWFLSSPGIERVIWSLTRHLKEWLTFTVDQAGYDQAEVVTISGFHQAHKWIRMLGGRWVRTIKSYGVDGLHDFEMYSWENL